MGTVGEMVDPRAVVVARRAAEQAIANGIDLPEDLELWRLAGGRPTVAAVPGEPEELGELLEEVLSPGERRSGGAHYTPRPLAAALAKRAVAGRQQPSVGDPSCGGGALLLAVARRMAAGGEAPSTVIEQLWGMDIDPVAVATTEVALALWAGCPPSAGHFVVGDALAGLPPWPALDVVIGNPPFLSQLDHDTVRSPALSARLRTRFGDAVRAYTDTAALFLLAACDLAAPGGTVALLQPQSVLGARDAAGVREAVARRGRVLEVWVPADPGFAAAVEVCVPIIEVGRSERSKNWTRHLARSNGVPVVHLARARRLGDEATVTAGFRNEYYGMVDFVRERADLPDGTPLITTGLIDLGGCAWGRRPARVGGRVWDAPVLDVDALEGRAADWVRRTRGPKIVVATQTRVIEVVVDEHGDWIPGVPMVVVLCAVDRLWPLAAALASPGVTAWLHQRTAGTALTSQAVKVSAAVLRDVPLPVDELAWDRGVVAFRSGNLDAYATEMSAAYATDAVVRTWWIERARTVWSPPAPPR